MEVKIEMDVILTSIENGRQENVVVFSIFGTRMTCFLYALSIWSGKNMFKLGGVVSNVFLIL